MFIALVGCSAATSHSRCLCAFPLAARHQLLPLVCPFCRKGRSRKSSGHSASRTDLLAPGSWSHTLHPDTASRLSTGWMPAPRRSRRSGARHKLSTSHVPPLQNRQDVEKVYLARVVGTFPAGRIKVHAALAWDARTNHTFVTSITALGAIQDTAAHPAAPADGQQRQQREATVDGDWAAQPAADMLPAGQSAEGSAFQGAPAAAQGRGVPASSMADGRVSEACPTGAPGQNSPASGMAMPPAGGNLLAAPNLEELQKYGLHSGGDELSAEDLERRKTVQGKDAVTEFRLLGAAPDGLTSVVQCRPLTGRTHQLRCAQGSLTGSLPCALDQQGQAGT